MWPKDAFNQSQGLASLCGAPGWSPLSRGVPLEEPLQRHPSNDEAMAAQDLLSKRGGLFWGVPFYGGFLTGVGCTNTSHKLAHATFLRFG